MIFALVSAAAIASEPVLSVQRGPGTGDITLNWSGGMPPFEIYRSEQASDVVDPLNLLATTFETSLVDTPSGTDLVFYRVRDVPVCTVSFAVGYLGNGNTCSFIGSPNATDLPAIALDEFHYNELFTGGGYDAPFGLAGGVFNAAAGPDWTFGTVGKARGCGACLEITGKNGSIVGMVREIADIGSVGSNGYATGVHIDNAYIDQVRNGSGPAVDVTIRPVPCPHSGNLLLKNIIYNANQPWYWIGLEYIPYNSVYPLLSMEIKAEVGHDQWYPLPQIWTNKWDLLNFQPQTIPVPDPPNGPVRFRFTSIYGDVLVSEPVQQVERPHPQNPAIVYYDMGVNFVPRSVPPGPCAPNLDCGNWTIDPGEECESSAQQVVDCSSLGAGDGTAFCDPGTCLWDRSTCSNP
jgi:hypothetical protein